jgi:hypothetical protein
MERSEDGDGDGASGSDFALEGGHGRGGSVAAAAAHSFPVLYGVRSTSVISWQLCWSGMAQHGMIAWHSMAEHGRAWCPLPPGRKRDATHPSRTCPRFPVAGIGKLDRGDGHSRRPL